MEAVYPYTFLLFKVLKDEKFLLYFKLIMHLKLQKKWLIEEIFFPRRFSNFLMVLPNRRHGISESISNLFNFKIIFLNNFKFY